jgi:hypothetical protein
MNRIMTALALSGMLIAAPAFAKTKTASTKSVATAGDKGSDTKAEGSTDAAKPAKKPSKKSSKKSAAPEGSSEKPAEAPAK